MVRYTMSVLSVFNRTTGKHTYYKEVCGVMRRISEKEYMQHDIQCDGKGATQTRVKGDKVRHWSTLIFYKQ